MLFIFRMQEGFEPISMQLSGGQLQPPVQKLVATMIISNPASSATNKRHPIGCRLFWLYVNSWGRDKKENIASRVGEISPARFSCTAEEDSISEIAEITHSEADPFQNFGLVVAAFNKTV